ncbi:hypothetical protein F2P56_013092, partial [Juglans regia]
GAFTKLRQTGSVEEYQTAFEILSNKNTGEVEYLSHIISKEEVKADPMKISAMIEWPIPKTPKALRGFLGLTMYYRKSIKGYVSIAAPLTALLKKNSFTWTEEANQAFIALKATMTTPPVLGLPNFSKMFVVECDASWEMG